jgi:hypothetical protein
MEHIKKVKIILIILAIVTSPYMFYKLQGPRIHWIRNESKNIGDSELDIFMVQNPPSSKEKFLELIKKMNDTINMKQRLKNDCYVQRFYKETVDLETFKLTRYYKPYYTYFIGSYVNIWEDDANFQPILAEYNYASDISIKKNEIKCYGKEMYSFFYGKITWNYKNFQWYKNEETEITEIEVLD